jgi:hypothetical protein
VSEQAPEERPQPHSQRPAAPQEAQEAGAAGEAGVTAEEPAVRELSARDRAVLDLAGRPWPGPGARDRAVRERLGMSPTAYLQLLNALLDDPLALAYAPVTVNRLRAGREERRREW